MYLLERHHWALLGALKEQGTLSAAAATLGITQSAATQRLREAERRLGVPLARKRGRVLTLTEAGETIANAARTVQPALRRAESEAIWQGKRTAHRLRLAFSHFDPPALVCRLAACCARVDPSVSVEILRVAQDGLVPALVAGKADFGLHPGSPPPSGIGVRHLVHDRLVAIFPQSDDPRTRTVGPDAFAGRPYLTFGLSPEPGWEYERFFERGRRFPAQAVRIESTEVICARVAEGAGVSILPRLCVRLSAYSGAVDVLELDHEAIAFDWHLLSGSDPAAGPTNLLKAVATRLRDWLPEEAS